MDRSALSAIVTACVLVVAGFVYATLDAFDIVPGILTFREASISAGELPTYATAEVVTENSVNKKSPSQLSKITSKQIEPLFNDMVAAVRKDMNSGSQNPESATFAITMLDAASGETVFRVNGDKLMIPASSTKILAATTALEVLGGTKNFQTQILAKGATLTLVGGGDQLLTVAKNQATTANGYASLEKLAQQAARVLKSRSIANVTLSYDTSLWGTDRANPDWRRDNNEDYEGSVVPLAVNAGAKGKDSFEEKPALEVAKALASALNQQGISVSGSVEEKKAPKGSEQIAVVNSAPVTAIVRHTLKHSDNTVADGLCRASTVKLAAPLTFAGEVRVVNKVISDLGLDQKQVEIRDCSGLSRLGRLTTDVLARTIRLSILKPELMSQSVALPVGGLDGTLHDRFSGKFGAGRVRAKTGSLDSERSLTGFVTTNGGHTLAFSIIGNSLEGRGYWKFCNHMDEFLSKVAAL